ncbi:hypothetical protein K438DRAFT_1760048 [Mycena galopus ATCC 62051]|nr:hypothetical protein K438DRAFT_1760048 [Mycena galopus ATCC 62051]
MFPGIRKSLNYVCSLSAVAPPNILAALGRANPELVDVALSQVDGLACQEVLGCNATALAEEYGITGVLAPREEVYGFILTTWQATLFEEDFNGWLRPYERFIPVRMDLRVLVQQLEWATAHPAEARLIQQPGLKGARCLVTDEQSDCYYLLALLEWARLQDYTTGLLMHK